MSTKYPIKTSENNSSYLDIAPVSYNAHEAAWQLKVTPDALRRKARRTGIGKREGQQWAFTPADIEALRSRESDRRYKRRQTGEEAS